jgi:hypothetical protein
MRVIRRARCGNSARRDLCGDGRVTDRYYRDKRPATQLCSRAEIAEAAEDVVKDKAAIGGGGSHGGLSITWVNGRETLRLLISPIAVKCDR